MAAVRERQESVSGIRNIKRDRNVPFFVVGRQKRRPADMSLYCRGDHWSPAAAMLL